MAQMDAKLLWLHAEMHHRTSDEMHHDVLDKKREEPEHNCGANQQETDNVDGAKKW